MWKLTARLWILPIRKKTYKTEALQLNERWQTLLPAVRKVAFWERLGLVLWPAFSGVILVEASKQIYAGVPVKEVRSRRRVVPVPAGVMPATTCSIVVVSGLDPGIDAGTDRMLRRR